jgi:membrane protein required for beta-lactamase induction
MVTLFMGPVNAILYGLIGLATSHALLSRAKPADRAG